MSFVALPEPDSAVLSRRPEILEALRRAVGAEILITDEEGRRAFETDALTAYRRVPLAVVLPRSTEDVSKVLRFCSEAGLKVVPRGAGTSLCGGALPGEDTVVVCVSKMNRVLDVDYVNRTARVEAGITNLAISGRVAEKDFFYAPDPSSQLACTIAGNLAMNSGGAHCLKYGVTVNNVLGLKMVLMDGSVVELGGAYLEPAGYDFLALAIGSEGQFGIVTEATVRILRKAEGARPMMVGFNSPEAAGQCVAGDHRRRHRARCHRIHGPSRDPGVRSLRAGRLSARCRSAAHHRGRRIGKRDRDAARRAWREIAQDFEPADH